MKKLILSCLIMTAVCLSAPSSAKHNSEASMAQRTAPVGQVYREGDKMATATVTTTETAAPAVRSAEDIYNASCTTCHATGAANAPKLGDIAAWESRIAKGIEALIHSAINGTGAMPAKGMCFDCSDDELQATVEYMVENSQ